MKIGRNDPCYCGSGKKYKQCCLNKSQPANEYELIRKTVDRLGYKEDLADILCNLLRYMNDNMWIGACHATCAVLYVTLSELGYKPKLCIGEVELPTFVFDHSWIELDGKVIDLAVSMTLMGGQSISEPIVLDYNIASNQRYNVVYGAGNGRGLDTEARIVMETPLNIYMNGFPSEKNGLWSVVQKISNTPVSIEELRSKYSEAEWEYVKK